jgi:hypothetical protein
MTRDEESTAEQPVRQLMIREPQRKLLAEISCQRVLEFQPEWSHQQMSSVAGQGRRLAALHRIIRVLESYSE